MMAYDFCRNARYCDVVFLKIFCNYGVCSNFYIITDSYWFDYFCSGAYEAIVSNDDFCSWRAAADIYCRMDRTVLSNSGMAAYDDGTIMSDCKTLIKYICWNGKTKIYRHVDENFFQNYNIWYVYTGLLAIDIVFKAA